MVVNSGGSFDMGYDDLKPTEQKVLDALIYNNEGKTFHALAEDVGISYRQFVRIRKKPHFKRVWQDASFEKMGDDLPQVNDALVKKAKSGDPRALELYYKLGGFIVDKRQVQVDDGRQLKDISNDVLEEEVNGLRELIDEAKDN